MKSKLYGMLGFDPAYLLILLILLIVILFICFINLNRKYNQMRKNYEVFMSGEDGKSLEESLLLKVQEIHELKKQAQEHERYLKDIQKKMEGSYQKVGIVKYNAFQEMGGQLSFALTLLDENDNGWLLNSMHSQEGCYLYIKEIVKGESELELTQEETESLEKAVFQKSEEIESA